MKNYPIYISNESRTKLFDLLPEIAELAKTQGQGTCTVHKVFYDQVKEILPKMNFLQSNYYDCDGKLAYTLRIGNGYTSNIKIDGETYKGLSFGAPRNHLSKYYRLRW